MIAVRDNVKTGDRAHFPQIILTALQAPVLTPSLHHSDRGRDCKVIGKERGVCVVCV